MKKILFLFILFSICTKDIFAAKKRKPLPKEVVSYQSGFYSFVHTDHKTTGNIYEINITIRAEDVLIDSVWFGATPVPCDVYETKTLQRISGPISRGKYLVKANRNLYQNFYRNIDSSFAYSHFAQPFPFKGELIIMYTYKEKRFFKTIKSIEERPQKSLRE